MKVGKKQFYKIKIFKNSIILPDDLSFDIFTTNRLQTSYSLFQTFELAVHNIQNLTLFKKF